MVIEVMVRGNLSHSVKHILWNAQTVKGAFCGMHTMKCTTFDEKNILLNDYPVKDMKSGEIPIEVCY